MTGNLTKSQSKYIKSLQQKKYRERYGQFVIEGEKILEEALAERYSLEYIVSTGADVSLPDRFSGDVFHTDAKIFSSLSTQKTPSGLLGVCRMAQDRTPDTATPILALDSVTDPGNLGTLIRLCDWFGIKQMFCGEGTVDVYNPKVVQATMGSIFRVAFSRGSIETFIEENSAQRPVIAADMNGDPIYSFPFPENFVLIMGSESHGPSERVLQLASHSITIPKFGQSESLNVAVAGGIILSEFRRQVPRL